MKPSTNRLTYLQVLEKTTPVYKKNFRDIAIIGAIIYSFGTSLSILFDGNSSIFLILVTVIFTQYLFFMFVDFENKHFSNLDRLLFSKANLFKLLKVFKNLLIILFLLLVLSFALIIPAVIFAILWSFWEFIVIEDKIPFKEILETSRQLVSGNWFYVFFYILLALFFSSLPPYIIYSLTTSDNPLLLFISNYFSGLVTAFFILGFAFIYRNLQKISKI